MRILPYLLVAAMAAPILIWFIVDKFLVKGTATSFGTSEFAILGSLGVVMILAFTLLSTWIDKFMQKTQG